MFTRVSSRIQALLTNTYYTTSNRLYASKPDQTAKNLNKQNSFHFEPSNLLPANKNHPDYTRIYKQIPIVIVLGWTGSNDYNVSKISQIYTSMGYHTIRFAPSFKLTFLQTKSHKEYCQQLANTLRHKLDLHENKAFVHTLSAAGYFIIYQNIIDKSVEDLKFVGENQRGAIFDSSVGMPVPFRKLVAGIADLSGVKSSILGHIIGVLGASVVSFYKSFIIPNDYWSRGFKKYIQDDSRQLPTLHIYSKADSLISSVEIGKVIDERKKLYPDMYLESAVFEDAEHVLIYKKYPERYVELIREHLEKSGLGLSKQALTSKL